jgi:hypothetical protein
VGGELPPYARRVHPRDTGTVPGDVQAVDRGRAVRVHDRELLRARRVRLGGAAQQPGEFGAGAEAEAHAERVGLQLPYAAVLLADVHGGDLGVAVRGQYAGALFDADSVPGEGEQIAGRLREPGGLPQRAADRGNPGPVRVVQLDQCLDPGAHLQQRAGDRQQEWTGPGQHHPLAHGNPVHGGQVQGEPGGDHARQRPAREGQGAFVRAGGGEGGPGVDATEGARADVGGEEGAACVLRAPDQGAGAAVDAGVPYLADEFGAAWAEVAESGGELLGPALVVLTAQGVGLVEQDDAQPAPGQDQRRVQSRRPAPDDRDVRLRLRHDVSHARPSAGVRCGCGCPCRR